MEGTPGTSGYTRRNQEEMLPEGKPPSHKGDDGHEDLAVVVQVLPFVVYLAMGSGQQGEQLPEEVPTFEFESCLPPV